MGYDPFVSKLNDGARRKMNIGITGATGFIGQNLYAALLEQEDSLKINKLETLDRRKYNLLETRSLEQFVQDKDIIFHFAGINRDNDPSSFITVNTIGTLNLLDAIRHSSNSVVKLVFASSLQVCGFTSTPERLSEGSPLKPTNIYGLSKEFAEKIVCSYSEIYGIHGLVFRFANVYGPRCKPNYNSVISTFINLALLEKPIVVQGGGNSSRDLIYVKDVVDACLRSLSYSNGFPEIFNVCTGLGTSVKKLVNDISLILKTHVHTVFTKDGAIDFLIGDPRKSKEKLGFVSKTSIVKGLAETIDWFKEMKKNECK